MNPRLVPLVVVLSLCVLAGCGAPTAATTTVPLATPMPSPTPTPDRDPFQVHVLQHDQVIACPTEPNPTNLCYTLHDDPSASALGTISFVGTDILSLLAEGSRCGPAERHGALRLAHGDTITIHATGRYRVPFYLVQFTFPVTGGTGTYRHASGGGIISVGPARNSPPTASEFWSGTIRPS